MEDSNREGDESVEKPGQEDDRGRGPCPCSPELFAARWNRALGPFRKKPFADDNDLVAELIRQEEALLRFSEECRIPDEFLGQLGLHRVAGGAEHEVFIPDGGSRVWKQTKRDRWGFKKDTPNDYLERLHALTSYAESLAILVEGIAVQSGIPSIVTSMAYVHGHHPKPGDLAAKLKREGWILIPDDTGLLVYRNPESGVVIRDAHPGNFIVAAQGAYVPIDVAIEGGNLHPQ